MSRRTSFNVDFPHVMLRYRAVELHEGAYPCSSESLSKQTAMAAGRRGRATRQLGERSPQHADPPIARKGRGHRPKCRSAQIPRRSFMMRTKRSAPAVDRTAPATAAGGALRHCFVNYNNPSIGEANPLPFSPQWVETEVLYLALRMPQLEQRISPRLQPRVDASRRLSSRGSTKAMT